MKKYSRWERMKDEVYWFFTPSTASEVENLAMLAVILSAVAVIISIIR